MNTLTRKQRERFDREQRILEVARPMLLAGGYHGLNMDRIAAELEYAKGTIYNHFACKEEILIALALQTQEKRMGLFQRAAAFAGRPRERLMAIGLASELFVRNYPEHFQVEQLIRSASLWEKTSLERQNLLRACEGRCFGIVVGIVRDALAQSDLKLPPEISAEDLVFALWSMSLGASTIITTSASLAELGVREPYHSLWRNIVRMLDGYGWKPLSCDSDETALVGRIQKEVFANEFRPAPRSR